MSLEFTLAVDAAKALAEREDFRGGRGHHEHGWDPEARFDRGFGGRRGEHRHGRGRERLFDAGDLKLVILKLLSEQPSYGYQLIKTMEERLAGGYTPSAGRDLSHADYAGRRRPGCFQRRRTTRRFTPSRRKEPQYPGGEQAPGGQRCSSAWKRRERASSAAVARDYESVSESAWRRGSAGFARERDGGADSQDLGSHQRRGESH